jgi:hypothetical protein
VWKDKSKKELAQQRAEAQRLADNRRIEATKPFLERQLKLYTEASGVAACIATGTNAAVDHTEIQTAKKGFGSCITVSLPLSRMWKWRKR